MFPFASCAGLRILPGHPAANIVFVCQNLSGILKSASSKWVTILKILVPMVPHTKINYWLVVYLPLWKILVSWDSNSQYMESRNPLSSLKTLVPECCSKLQRTNSTSKIAKADKYCKMNNWKQARWHSCFNRWARLRPVVQAVGLAAKRKMERTEEMDLWHPESTCEWVKRRVGQCPCCESGWGAWNTHTKRNMLHWHSLIVLHPNMTCHWNLSDEEHVQIQMEKALNRLNQTSCVAINTFCTG